jgi:hypothetical protein
MHTKEREYGNKSDLEIVNLWVKKGNSADKPASTHFLIRPDGRILHFIPIDIKAWHGGTGANAGIGIDLEGFVGGTTGEQKTGKGNNFPSVQIQSLKALLSSSEFSNKAVTGHWMWAPERRSDPGLRFKWWEFIPNGQNRVPTELAGPNGEGWNSGGERYVMSHTQIFDSIEKIVKNLSEGGSSFKSLPNYVDLTGYFV